MKKKNYYFLITKICGLLLVPLVLLLLPATFFDQGQSWCVRVLLTGTECYGCGMTRAIMHLIHLDFTGAAGFNKLAFVSFPVLSFLWAKAFWKDFNLLIAYRHRKNQVVTE